METAPGSTGMLNRGPNHSLGTSKEGYVKPTRTCVFPGCGRPHKARGLCSGHYQQQRKGQDLRSLHPHLTKEQRFWTKVNKSSINSCWLWTAFIKGEGYGMININGRPRLAHRVSWELTNGPISEGMELDHRCGNRSCVNPDHLRVTTRSQNAQHLTGARKNSTSGVRGVYWNKRDKAWHARATLNGRHYSAGYYTTVEEADEAVRALRAELFTHDDHDQWVKTIKEYN